MSIRTVLKAGGARFCGQSDTEVLLNLYLAEGTGMLSRLNGIFAFALWDSDLQTLFLARDALALRPDYVSYRIERWRLWTIRPKNSRSGLRRRPDISGCMVFNAP
ncbi:hypothetical protein [uncultured Lamprocystis sp.]|uniref:hypothetical protein n=1 Tax=uncultured Lamprocystis sp. TaxID=543132 RepID=UPI0034263C47